MLPFLDREQDDVADDCDGPDGTHEQEDLPHGSIVTRGGVGTVNAAPSTG